MDSTDNLTNRVVIGLDALRPPTIQRQPVLDLFFELDAEADAEWCDDFNNLIGRTTYPFKIDPEVGLFIETWVRQPREIASALEKTKEFVSQCNRQYIAKKSVVVKIVDGVEVEVVVSQAQLDLNKVVSQLSFDHPED